MLTVNQLTSFGAGGEKQDEHFGSVELLIMPSGGDSSIVDLSSRGRSISISGTTVSLTDTSPYFAGRKRVAFGGSGYLTAPASSDWQILSDYTIEWLGELDSAPGTLLSLRATEGSYQFYVTSELHINLAYSTNGTVWTAIPGTSSPVVSLETEHLIALRRSGSTVSIHVDNDTPVYSATLPAFYNPDLPLSIGSGSSSGLNIPMVGKMDGLRLTRGVARTIVKPSEPWPTS